MVSVDAETIKLRLHQARQDIVGLRRVQQALAEDFLTVVVVPDHCAPVFRDWDLTSPGLCLVSLLSTRRLELIR